MFRIRRIFDDIHQRNLLAIARVQELLVSRFDGLSQSKIDRVPDLLKNPLKYDFRSILYVAERSAGAIQGFALMSHDPQLNFSYLDYLATAAKPVGRGIGAALYARLREEAALLKSTGIFFECLPDDPALCRDPKILEENKARLRFYETFGARPIINTAYETPVHEDTDNPPYLVFDDLGLDTALTAAYARKVVRAILQTKYPSECGPEYIRKVVRSFTDDPVQIRTPRYTRKLANPSLQVTDELKKIFLVSNDRHAIHHVRERGYVQSPVRVSSILKELEKTRLFSPGQPQDMSDRHILTVHDKDYVQYFRKICEQISEKTSIYPYVFPIRNRANPPVELAVRAGYYAIDTFTPISRNAYMAARRAVDCALTGASKLISGTRLAYALVRPPGHHAEKNSFGGFCYFNNAAIAGHHLSGFGTVAMLDIDYHHGNGQQMIFYNRNDILTISIHGHPSFAYPYFSGFSEEKGEDEGSGFNINFPLAEHVTIDVYMRSLEKALRAIRKFQPRFLIICLGLDTARGDPTGTWNLNRKDFNDIGQRIGQLRLPTLVVQEGGYNTRSIGINARAFFEGLWKGTFNDPREQPVDQR